MFFIMVANSLLRRRARMAIALLAVAVGATIISGMITVYKEVPEQMGRAFRAYGANLLILPGKDAGVIHEEDVSAVSKALSDYEVVGITPFLYDTPHKHHRSAFPLEPLDGGGVYPCGSRALCEPARRTHLFSRTFDGGAGQQCCRIFAFARTAGAVSEILGHIHKGE